MIRAMQGYVPGEQPRVESILKLNTNESPYPPSPRVFEAIQAVLTGDQLRKYPDPSGRDFRRAAAVVLGVEPEQILIGNGSDDVLTILTRAFVPEGGVMATLTPSYILYRNLAEIQGAELKLVPFTADWQIPTNGSIPEADLTFLANPNSPSGTMLDGDSIRHFLDQFAGPLVLDEAYVDFAEHNGLELLATGRVIITRTLSKSYALAGMRFGYAVAEPGVIAELLKVKDSYNCDVLSLAAATAAISDQSYLAEVRRKITATRQRLESSLQALGFQVTPSATNFVWCRRLDRPVQPVYVALKERGILIRYMHYPNYGDGLRITVGTDTEIDRLLEELRALL